MPAVRFGLTLPNRGVIIGATTVDEMLALAEKADAEPAWDSVWVGDSILAKPRLDALDLLSALAVRTRRVKLGPACMASTPLRPALLLAYQWASLDYIAKGRTIFVACQGQREHGGLFEHEFRAFGIDPETRMRRMEEAIEILRLTSTQENVSYHGQFNRFDDVTILPRPTQQPIPIWIVGNPNMRLRRNAEQAYRRVAQLGDGWQTTILSPDEVRTSVEMIRGYAREIGRTLPPDFEVCLYYNINVNEDREAALHESKRFLDDYYSRDYSRSFLEGWVALGSVEQCVAQLQRFIDAGVTTITLRLTGYDQERQFKRVTQEVLPAFA